MSNKQNYESKFYDANLCSSHKGWDDMQALFQEVDKEITDLKMEIDADDRNVNNAMDQLDSLGKELEAKDKLIAEAFREGYEQGHNATVEGYYSPEEATDDYIEELTNQNSVRIKG